VKQILNILTLSCLRGLMGYHSDWSVRYHSLDQTSPYPWGSRSTLN
jgi:hypothetical protein